MNIFFISLAGGQVHSGWTPFYFMYDPKCSTTFPRCTINAPVAIAWCTINVPAVFAWCTNHFVHKVEFSYIGWNGVHPLWCQSEIIPRNVSTQVYWLRNDINKDQIPRSVLRLFDNVYCLNQLLWITADRNSQRQESFNNTDHHGPLKLPVYTMESVGR